jgi:hypothetical protein
MKIDNKQKVLITLIVIALAYVLWQVYSQFFRGPSTAAVPAPATRPVAARPAPPAGRSRGEEGAAAPSSSRTLSPVQPAPKNAIPTPGGFTLEAPINDYQNKYLELVNEYQLLRMRRMIVDEEASIASAEERIAKINQTAGRGAGELSVTGETTNPTGYKLMYIDFQNGEWNATLSKEGRFLEVNMGDVLIDGARIIQINQQGVVIEKNQNRYLLTFYGTKSLGEVKPVKLDNTLAPSNLFIKSAPAVSVPMVPSASVKKTSQPPSEKTTKTKVVTPITKTEPSPKTTDGTTTVIKVAPPTRPPAAAPPSAVPAIPNKTNDKPNNNKTPASTASPPPAGMIVIPMKPTQPSSSVPPVPGTTNTSKVQPPLKAPQTANAQPPASTAKTAPVSSALKLTAEQKNTYNALQSLFGDEKPTSLAESPEKMQQAITPADPNSPLSFSQDEKYLLTIPGNYYVVQIMGSNNRNDLTRLLREYHLDSQARGFQTHHLDQNWYILVYGVYKNSQDAANAVAQLPSGIQQLKPWVRSVASIHDAIHLRRDVLEKQINRRSNSRRDRDPGIEM